MHTKIPTHTTHYLRHINGPLAARPLRVQHLAPATFEMTVSAIDKSMGMVFKYLCGSLFSYALSSHSTFKTLSGWCQRSLKGSLHLKTCSISCFVARIKLSSDSMLTASMGFVKIRTIAFLLSLSLSSSLVLWWITPADYSFKGNKIYALSIALVKIAQIIFEDSSDLCIKASMLSVYTHTRSSSYL